MCSPEELQKLLNDDTLFKQYIILRIDRISEAIDKTDICDNRIDELSKKVEVLTEKIDKIEGDITFFKRLTIGLATAIAGLLGINLGVI